MLTNEDITRIKLQGDTQIRRIKAAEEACKRSTTTWSKNFWYNTFKKLCRKYNKMDYFKKSIN